MSLCISLLIRRRSSLTSATLEAALTEGPHPYEAPKAGGASVGHASGDYVKIRKHPLQLCASRLPDERMAAIVSAGRRLMGHVPSLFCAEEIDAEQSLSIDPARC